MINIKWLSIAGVSTLISMVAHAQPTISEIEGGASIGSNIRIVGQGFGSPQFDVVLRDTGDQQLILNGLDNEISIAQSELWKQGSAWATPLVPSESESLRRGSDSVVYRGEGKAYMGWPKAFENQSNRSLFISWWFNPLEDPGSQGGSNKFLRVWDNPDGAHTRMAWDQDHIIYWRKDVDSSGFIQWGGWNGNVGAWNKIDCWMDDATHQMTIWVNGKKVIDVNDFNKSSDSNALTAALIGFDPSYSDRYPNMVFGVDDIYMSNSQARIEVSNSSTWTQGIVTEILTPMSWTDTQITTTLESSLVDISRPIYIFVVNENGEVNNEGFPVSSRAPSKIDFIEVN